MGQPIATASNLGQGWRTNRNVWTAQQKRDAGINPSGQVKSTNGEKPMGMGMDYDRSKTGFPTGNKYRAKHDDGSRKSRGSAGAPTRKHTTPLAGNRG